MSYAIDLTTVQSVAKLIKKDLVISPATLTNSELEKLKFKIITGVENVESEFISLAYSGAIRPYDLTKNYSEDDAKEVAMLVERKLKVYLSCRIAFLNLQRFREKEPFPTTDKVDMDTLERLPQTEFTLRQAGEYYGQEVLQAIFHGKRSLGSDSPLGIFDGIYALVAKDMTTYEDENGNTVPVLISAENGNLIETGALTKPTSTTDYSAYEEYESFVESLDSELLDNPDGVLVYVDKKKAPFIYQAYMNRYPSLQNAVKYDGTYQFFTMDKVTLIGTPLMGKTDTMIATRPGNLQFGIMSERDENNVDVKSPGIDPNKLSMWIQSVQGVRILNPTKGYFAISCQEGGTLHDVTPYKFGDLQLPAPQTDVLKGGTSVIPSQTEDTGSEQGPSSDTE